MEETNGTAVTQVFAPDPHDLAARAEAPIRDILQALTEKFQAEVDEMREELKELADAKLNLINARHAQDFDNRAADLNKRIEELYESPCAFLNRWHKEFTARRGSLLISRDTSRRMIADWKRQEEAAAEEERRKLEHAQRMLKEQERQAELAALKAQGRTEEAKAVEATPIETPVVPVVQRSAITGSSVVKKACGVVKDLGALMAYCATNALHRDCFTLDQGAVDRKIQAGVPLPGVERGIKEIVSNRGRR
jgi:hypothetical protein